MRRRFGTSTSAWRREGRSVGCHGMSPLITYYDDAAGERVELTAAEVGSWSAATASLLTSECGLAAGGRVGVLLPPHWQTAVVLLGAWSAGMEISFRGWG